MKKLFLLLAIAIGISTTTLYAQEQRDPAQQAQRMRERMKPELIQRSHISDAQANQVLDLYQTMRQEMRAARDLAADERQSKMNEANGKFEKALVGIGLTDQQRLDVVNYFTEQRERMRNRQQNGGGGGGR
ncbi:MAG: hypothetical protein EOO15_16105 [Chitinophagaceae bacterium]|nr:MAG: hypothetical protein EOO15_16105 [Chitinophagaceae bacterium]